MNKWNFSENEPNQDNWLRILVFLAVVLIAIIFMTFIPRSARSADICPSVQDVLLSGEFVNNPISVYSGADSETVECSLKFAPPSGFSMYAGVGSVQIMCITRSPWKFKANGYVGSYQIGGSLVAIKFEDDYGITQIQRVVVGLGDYKIYPYVSNVVWVRQ